MPRARIHPQEKSRLYHVLVSDAVPRPGLAEAYTPRPALTADEVDRLNREERDARARRRDLSREKLERDLVAARACAGKSGFKQRTVAGAAGLIE